VDDQCAAVGYYFLAGSHYELKQLNPVDVRCFCVNCMDSTLIAHRTLRLLLLLHTLFSLVEIILLLPSFLSVLFTSSLLLRHYPCVCAVPVHSIPSKNSPQLHGAKRPCLGLPVTVYSCTVRLSLARPWMNLLCCVCLLQCAPSRVPNQINFQKLNIELLKIDWKLAKSFGLTV